MKKVRSVAVVLAIVVGTMFTLGSTSAGASSAGTTVVKGKTIKILAFQFKPNYYEAAPGEVIRVVNLDGRRHGVPHSLSANNGSFDTGPFIQGSRFVTAPTARGTYPWHCEIHPFMYGELVVH